MPSPNVFNVASESNVTQEISRNTARQFIDDIVRMGLAKKALDQDEEKYAVNRKRRHNEAKRQQQELKQETESWRRTTIAATGAAIVAYSRLSSTINGLRRAGMDNTVEANRQELAYTLLGRQIAAIYLPATKAATNASIAGTNALTGLTGKGQDAIFVLGSMATGFATLTVAMLAARAAGIKFTGVMGGLVRLLPVLGVAGGLIGSLGLLFLSSNEGAKTLEETMKRIVEEVNNLGSAFDDLMKNPGKFWDDVGLGMATALEYFGILEKGMARKHFDKFTVPGAKARGGLDARRAAEQDGKRRDVTPGQFRFEGVADAFERVQIAAAKAGIDNVQQKQLDTQKEQLAELKKIRVKGHMAGLIAAGAKGTAIFDF